MENHSTRKTFRATWLVLAVISLCLISAQGFAADRRPDSRLNKIKHIVVIYQENWSFDSLYGLFPGANGLFQSPQQSLTQIDRLTGQPYSSQLGQPFDLVSGSVS